MLARAERALQDDEFENAIAFVQNARVIRPDHPGIEAVDTLVHEYGERWLAQAEESAADTRPARQTPAAPPPRRETTAPAVSAPRPPTRVATRQPDPAPATPPQTTRTPAAAAPEPPPTQPSRSTQNTTPAAAAPEPPARSAPPTQQAPRQAAPATSRPTPSPAISTPTPPQTDPRLARVAPRPEETSPPGQVSTATMINDMSRLANRRMDEGRLLEPAGDSAKFYIQALQQAAPEHPVVSRDRDRLAALFLGQARTAMAGQQLDVAERWLTEAKALEGQGDAITSTTNDLQRARSASTLSQPPETTARTPGSTTGGSSASAPVLQGLLPPQPATRTAATTPQAAPPPVSPSIVQPAIPATIPAAAPVPVSELQFRKYVQPKYPRTARSRNVDGWVELEFTVNTDGNTKDIKIGAAQPPNQFEEAAIDAVKKWEFEPEYANGQLVEKRALVRVRFKVE